MKRLALACLTVAGAALAVVPDVKAEGVPVRTAVQRTTDGDSNVTITPVRRRFYGGGYYRPYRSYGYGSYNYGAYRPSYGSYYRSYRPGYYYRPYSYGYARPYGSYYGGYYGGGYGPTFSIGVW